MGNGTFICWACDPKRWGSRSDFSFIMNTRQHYLMQPMLRMLVKEHGIVLGLKGLWCPVEAWFSLICMNSLCSVALGRWIFVRVGYNSRHTLRVMGMSGRICILMERRTSMGKLAVEIHKYQAKNIPAMCQLDLLEMTDWYFADFPNREFFFKFSRMMPL